MNTELLRKYKKLKDKISEAEAHFDSLIKPQKAKLAEMEAEILSMMQEGSINSIKNDEATFFTKTVSSAAIEDLEAVTRFIRENNAFDLLQRRISVDAYKNYLESGITVPGIKLNSILKLSVRKK